MQRRAILVGNSDGIGLATRRRLLAAGWDIKGVSRSESSISNAAYHHRIADVRDSKYSDLIDDGVVGNTSENCYYLDIDCVTHLTNNLAGTFRLKIRIDPILD